MNSRIRSSNKKSLPLQTFTYFIPAPPHRKNGYREREFDKIVAGFSGSGFEILDIQSASVGTSDAAGVFIIVVVRPLNKKVQLLDTAQDLHEKYKLTHSHSSPDIVLEEDV
jgi:hypothetical protein